MCTISYSILRDQAPEASGIARSYSGSRGSKLRSNCPASALSLNFRLACVRSGGSDARRSDLGAFGARPDVVLERPGSIFEAEIAVFSMLRRARARAQRTCPDRAPDPLKLMFCAHQSIARQDAKSEKSQKIRSASLSASCFAKDARKSRPERSPRRLRAAPGPLRSAPGPSKSVLGASGEPPEGLHGRFWSALDASLGTLDPPRWRQERF